MGVCLTLEEALEDGLANTTIASFRPFPLAKREGIISVAARGGPANRLLPGDSHTDARCFQDQTSQLLVFFCLGMTTLSQFPVSGKEVPVFLKARRPKNSFQENVLNYRCFCSGLSRRLWGQIFPSTGVEHVIVVLKREPRREQLSPGFSC